MRKLLLLCITISVVSLSAGNKNFKTFTGKVVGSKVRLRTAPNLEGKILKELNKGSIFLVVGEKDNYYAVAPKDTKLYVYEKYISNNIAEADRVNIRLHPSLESPIIGQLTKNQTITGGLYSKNKKWLEITPPDNIYFYVAKEYIKKAGDNSFYSLMSQRKEEVDKLLNSAFFLAQAECKKPYLNMKTKSAISQFEAIIKGYSDFQSHVKQAKEGLSLLQDTYLQKKISYLEQKANMDPIEKAKIFNEISSFEKKIVNNKSYSFESKLASLAKSMTNKMKKWIPSEKEIFSTWTTYHPDKSMEEFYVDQKANAIYITGIIRNYEQNIKNKPGNYILQGDSVSCAYLYSTIIDLEKYVGKKITILVSPRPNNNFAFPAYFVNTIK